MGRKGIKTVAGYQFQPCEWKSGCSFSGKADAEKVQMEIDALASVDPNGKCSPKAMVDFAQRHPASELHKCFEWDDTKAANAYRLSQATEIKLSIVTPVQKMPITPASVTVKVATNHALKSEPGQGHKNIEIVVNSQTDLDALDKDMYDSLGTYINSFRKRFVLAPNYDTFVKMLNEIEAQLP